MTVSRIALGRPTDRTDGKQEVDREQLAHQPAHILGGRLQLLGQLLFEVLPRSQERVIEEPLPKVREIQTVQIIRSSNNNEPLSSKRFCFQTSNKASIFARPASKSVAIAGRSYPSLDRRMRLPEAGAAF